MSWELPASPLRFFFTPNFCRQTPNSQRVPVIAMAQNATKIAKWTGSFISVRIHATMTPPAPDSLKPFAMAVRVSVPSRMKTEPRKRSVDSRGFAPAFGSIR